MKYNIFGKPKPEPEVSMALQLEVAGDAVFVIAVDKNGKKVLGGNLLQFCSDGGAYRYSGVNPDLGFRLDSYGLIRKADRK